MQFVKFLSLLPKCELSNSIYEFFSLLKCMDYPMQILDFISLLHKHGLSYIIYEISFPSPKTWTILRNFGNSFTFSKKHRLSYAIYGISFPSQKTWTIICNIWNFFPLSKNMDYHM